MSHLLQLSSDLRQLFSLHPTADETALRGSHSNRRLEIMLDLESDNPDLSLKVVLNNNKGYLDLWMDFEDDEDDDEYEYEFEDSEVEAEEGDTDDDSESDPDFDKLTRDLGEGVFLYDHRRDIESQLKVIAALGEDFIRLAGDFMEKYTIANLTLGLQFATFSFADEIDELMTADKVATMLNDAQAIFSRVE